MKKNLLLKSLLLVLSGLVVATATAQITVTRNDFANIGDMTISAHDTIPSVSAGNAGAAQTWDLSAIANIYSDTTVFSMPSSTPYAANFPTANLAGYNAAASTYYFAYGSNTGIDINGVVVPNPFTGAPMILTFIPVLTQIAFPSTYNSSFSSNGTGQATFFYQDTLVVPFDSVRFTRATARNSIIDGWGAVVTPAGAFSDCLRQKMTDINTTTVEIYATFPLPGWVPAPFGGTDTVIDYYYLTNNQKWALAQITTDAAGNVTDAQYLVSTIIGIEEFSFAGNNDVLIYPNPSAGAVNISVINGDAAILDVYDMVGRQTEKISLGNAAVIHSFESYAEGMYTFWVLNNNGKPISSGKFVIEK